MDTASGLQFFIERKRLFKWLKGSSLLVFLYSCWVLGTVLCILISYFLYTETNTILWPLTFITFMAFFKIGKSELALQIVVHMDGLGYFKDHQFICDEKTIADSNTLLLWHPHGVFCLGFCFHGCWNPILRSKNIFFGMVSVLRNAPIFSLVCDANGRLVDVSKETMLNLFKKGKNYAFLPGGFEEATLTTTGKDRVYIQKRQGFVKYALQYGYCLQPVYTFGESDAYHTFNKFEKFRLYLNQFKIPGTIVFGEWFCPILPVSSRTLNTVVGESIQLPMLKVPTNEDITYWHNEYIKGLQKLYDENVDKYGHPGNTLEIL